MTDEEITINKERYKNEEMYYIDFEKLSREDKKFILGEEIQKVKKINENILSDFVRKSEKGDYFNMGLSIGFKYGWNAVLKVIGENFKSSMVDEIREKIHLESENGIIDKFYF